jgi:hypothetical protein
MKPIDGYFLIKPEGLSDEIGIASKSWIRAEPQNGES